MNMRSKKQAASILLCSLSTLTACGGFQSHPAPVEERDGYRATEQVTTAEALAESEVITETEQPQQQDEIQPESRQIEQLDNVEKDQNVSGINDTEPVVLAFLEQAESQAASGNSQQAIASLERGIRVKPKDPWLWHQLGVLKLRTQQWLDAISIAEKSNSLAGKNRQLTIGNWQLIAEAHEALGNLHEAEKARNMIKNM